MSPNDRPLRILLLNEFFYPDNQGGTATATSNIARHLVDSHNVEVAVVTGRYGYRDPNERFEAFTDWRGVKVYRTGNPNWGRDRPAKRLIGNLAYAMQVAWRSLWLPRPDVVMVTTAPLTLPMAATLLLRLRGVPYVYLIYDLDPDRTVALHVKPEDARSVRVLRQWQSRWLSRSARVVTIGRCMRDLVAKRYGVHEDKIDVVPVGADPDVIRPLARETKFRAKLGLEGFVVLYSGNFGQYHDFDTLLLAAERLQGSRPDIRFVLVGGGKKREYVEQEVARRRLSNVCLHGFVPEEELSDLLASADLLVVTLEPGMEGICVPSKFYACLAAGRPVLALMAPHGEVAQVLQESSTGYRIPTGDADQLVTLLTDISGGPQSSSMLSEMGERARDVFDREYSSAVVAGRLVEILEKGRARS